MKKFTSQFILLLILSFLSLTLRAAELPDFTELVEKYGPAVVNISTTAKKTADKKEKEDDSANKQRRSIPGMPEGTPLDDLFRHFFDQQDDFDFEERPNPSTSLGSGFILTNDGYVVTNSHVVGEANEIIVRLNDRREYVAKLIGSDKRSDIALLKVEATELPTIKLGSSRDLKVGEWVLAIGSPFGFDYSVTAGIVSAKGRNLPNDTYVPFIQTDVAINPGNSGGPLFNMKGEVIGVNSQIYSRTGGFMGLSFAIPVDVMKDVVEQLKTTGKVSRGWLGVLIQDVNGDLAQSFGMEKPQGALVAQVLPDSPAKKSKFKVGDIIVEFNGKPVTHSSDLPPIVGSTPINSEAEVKIIRDGKQEVLKVTIGELPSEEEIGSTMGSSGKSMTSNVLALSVKEIDDDARSELGIESGGVIVERVEEGAAKDAGINKGDVIAMINNASIESVSHFKEIVGKLEPSQVVPVLIYRSGSPRFLALKIPKK
jgi:serine protease Do